MSWSEDVVAVRQFVPFARHGAWPPIKSVVKLAEFATMLEANKFVEVTLVKMPLLEVKVVTLRLVPVALVKTN